MSENNNRSNRKRTWIAIGALFVLVLGALAAWYFLSPRANAGEKEITVNVDHLVGEDTTFTFSTEAEYLRQALEEQSLVEGTESEYGLWVTSVDGETADEDAQQWWGYSVNGALSEYGVDSQVVSDGDVFDFVLNVGW